MATKPDTIEHLDAAIARWKTRMKTALTKVTKLEAKRKRLLLKQSLAAAAPVSPMKEAFNVDLQAELESRKLIEREPAPVVAAREAFAEAERVLQPPPGFMELAGAGIERPKDDGLAIPEFLKRGVAKEFDRLKEEKAAEQAVADSIRAEQAERKKLKARGRIATMKAKQSGATKRMPLTGKAALAALRET